MVVPERGVGWFKQGLVSEQGGARRGHFILEGGGDVLGRGATKDLQPFLQHPLPALQRPQHSVTQRRAHRQICVKKKQKDNKISSEKWGGAYLHPGC